MSEYLPFLRDALARVRQLQGTLSLSLKPDEHERANEAAQLNQNDALPVTMESKVYDALYQVDPRCAEYYRQAYFDLSDTSRVSWIGTVHEIREALATMLRTLAPDNDVKAMGWFKYETNDGRPTQKQRVRYIMANHRAGTSEKEVVDQIELIEDRVASVVRSIYSRASNAAHSGTGRTEVIRIIRYFEAFSHDLLNIDGI